MNKLVEIAGTPFKIVSLGDDKYSLCSHVLELKQVTREAVLEALKKEK